MAGQASSGFRTTCKPAPTFQEATRDVGVQEQEVRAPASGPIDGATPRKRLSALPFRAAPAAALVRRTFALSVNTTVRRSPVAGLVVVSKRVDGALEAGSVDARHSAFRQAAPEACSSGDVADIGDVSAVPAVLLRATASPAWDAPPTAGSHASATARLAPADVAKEEVARRGAGQAAQATEHAGARHLLPYASGLAVEIPRPLAYLDSRRD